MYWCMMESRSDNDYGQSDSDADEPSFKWYDILLFPVYFVIAFVFGAIFSMLPILAGIWFLLTAIYSSIKTKIKSAKSPWLFFVCLGILLAVVLALGFFHQHHNTPMPPTHPPKPTGTAPHSSVPAPTDTTTSRHPPTGTAPHSSVPVPTGTTTSRRPPTSTTRAIAILLDDFSPQPYQGESVYFFNRLGGDRGAVNNSILDWGNGQVTTTISSGNSWGGVWMSLNHPIREGLPINFSATSPPQILPAYQSQITGITAVIVDGTPGRTFKLELKDRGALHWKKEVILDGGPRVVSSDLPALGNINELLWVLDYASAGDYVILESISFMATTQITDTATAVFVWSYGMLLNNWNPTTGLVRDKAKDASGEFDAIQATGSLAAATAVAEQLGFVTHADAVQIVGKISDTLLLDLPRFHGLWPHWVKVSPVGEITIVPNTEWSSVDTVIAAIGLLDAQSGLGMDTSGTEQMLQAIDWNDLVTPNGISHGYTYSGDLIPYAWDVFGGESWLVELAYAGVTGQVAPITYPSPPTANGSGFIDELAWLFVSPPSGQDYWGTDWTAYRLAAAGSQIDYHPTQNPSSCFAQLRLFGLSAAEVPDPSSVPQGSIYQAFGAGGRFASANDGSTLLGAPVVVPHYAAMIASLRPQEAIEMWDWLIDDGYFSPLNNAESLLFPSSSGCDSAALGWNQLKGSWNLSLQTLGWGRYLAERDGQVPILWQATTANPLLRKGYLLLTPSELSLTPTSTPTRENTQTLTPEAGMVIEGGDVNALAIDPATPITFYAATDGGVFKSMNGGRNWSAVNAGLTDTNVKALAIDPLVPVTLYAGTSSGVFKSTNGGANWTAVNTGLTYTDIYALAIDLMTPTTVYAGTYHGIFESTNDGENWSAVNISTVRAPTSTDNDPTGLHITPKYTVAFDPVTPTTLYAGTYSYIYPGTWRYVRGGVFKSTNGGGSWSRIYDGNTNFRVLVVDPATPTTLYVGTDYMGILKSTNSGKDWSAINSGLTNPTIYALTFEPETPTTLYVLTGDGVFKSTNGGRDWSEFNSGP